MDKALAKLAWMGEQQIWPNGKRYLWTDAYGVVLLVSLFRATGDERFLDEAKHVVSEVERVLGRPRGMRIGEAPDRYGQYFHYLGMWIFALTRLGAIDETYRRRALELVRQIHRPFVASGHGVFWKMKEDLSGRDPEYGFGALDPFEGYVVYRLLDERELAGEMAEMRALMNPRLHITQDLGLGMMLWMTHFFPEEEWARTQREMSIAQLDAMWIDPPGYFCREPGWAEMFFAFTNYGVSIGLQSVGAMPERVARLNAFFEKYESGDEYDRDAITHVMAACSWFPGEFL